MMRTHYQFYEKAVDEWLANAEKYEGARTPEEIIQQYENT